MADTGELEDIITKGVRLYGGKPKVDLLGVLVNTPKSSAERFMFPYSFMYLEESSGHFYFIPLHNKLCSVIPGEGHPVIETTGSTVPRFITPRNEQYKAYCAIMGQLSQ